MQLSNFQVTLAKPKAAKIDFDNTQYFVQPKLDGVRCYITKDGAFSRNHKEFKNVDHLIKQLKPIFDYAPELILDGELYNHEFKNDFNKIISLVRKTKPSLEARLEADVYIQFHCYDIFDLKRPELPYIERLAIIRHLFEYKYRTTTRSVRTVDTKFVANEQMIQDAHKINLAKGYEGSMLRANVAYENRRSHSLQKVKDFHDTEFTITGFVEGRGKFAGGLGKFLGKDLQGRDIEVPFQRCTIEERRRIWKDRNSYLGKIATFEFFERTPAGAYRFPQFKALRNYE